MSNEKPKLSLLPVEGEVMPVGEMPTLTAEQVNVVAAIEVISKVEVLANAEETAKGVIALKASYLPVIEKAKADLSAVITKADLDRAKRPRLNIADERVKFTKCINAELSSRRELIKNAVTGRDAVENALSSIEDELLAVEKPIENGFKAEAARKKSLADAMAKLKNHAINPLLSSAEIEAAIDDFTLAFGDSDYQESQSVAESIFESKINEFEVILSAAVVREENERKIKEQEKQAQQRANINVMFPLAEISGYGNRTAADIKARIDWIAKVDMSAFELVLSEAETAKQSCLNILNALFLPMVVAREAKEAAAKAEVERLEREKQYQDDWDSAITENNAIDLVRALVSKKQAEIDAEVILEPENESSLVFTHDAEKMAADVDLEIESAVIAFINNDLAVAEDVARIIGEPCFEDAEPIEVLSEANEDDWVSIPVKHLKALIYAAEHCGLDEDDGTIAAIEFAKSII